jgi:hypothetical protein
MYKYMVPDYFCNKYICSNFTHAQIIIYPNAVYILFVQFNFLLVFKN